MLNLVKHLNALFDNKLHFADNNREQRAQLPLQMMIEKQLTNIVTEKAIQCKSIEET